MYVRQGPRLGSLWREVRWYKTLAEEFQRRRKKRKENGKEKTAGQVACTPEKGPELNGNTILTRSQ